jgi:hypothetical protein
VADSRNDKSQKKENVKNVSNGTTDKEELDQILGKLSESSGKDDASSRQAEETVEIIKKPEGTSDQPEDIEGMLDKLTEKPDRPVGFFQRLLNFFRKT